MSSAADQRQAAHAVYYLGGEAKGWRLVKQYDGRYTAFKAPVRVYPYGAGYLATFEAGGVKAQASGPTAPKAVDAVARAVRQNMARAVKNLAELGL